MTTSFDSNTAFDSDSYSSFDCDGDCDTDTSIFLAAFSRVSRFVFFQQFKVSRFFRSLSGEHLGAEAAHMAGSYFCMISVVEKSENRKVRSWAEGSRSRSRTVLVPVVVLLSSLGGGA